MNRREAIIQVMAGAAAAIVLEVRPASAETPDLSASCNCGHEYGDHYTTHGGDVGCASVADDYEDSRCYCLGFEPQRRQIASPTPSSANTMLTFVPTIWSDEIRQVMERGVFFRELRMDA